MALKPGFNPKHIHEPSVVSLGTQGSNRFLMLTDQGSPCLPAEMNHTAESKDTDDMFNHMLECARADPPFTLTFQVMMSNYDRGTASLSVKGNRRMTALVHDIYQRPYMHSAYHNYLYRAHMKCNSFLNALRAAAKVPQSQVPVSNVDGKQLTQDDFDVCLTIELDQTLQHQTRIETGPRCPKAMIRVLNEGPAYDMEDIWFTMKNVVVRVFLSTYVPLCGIDEMSTVSSGMMEGASVEGASVEGGQSAADTNEK